MFAILVDVTRCTGCEDCVEACVLERGLDPRSAERDRARTKDGLTSNRLCTLIPVAEGRFARKSCMHCLEPSCVSACLVGGLTKTPEGAVVYDPDKCIGCRYCMLACPFHIPRYQWSQTTPFVQKCNLCFSRLQQGKSPACVEACTRQALIFGEREETLELARTRIRRDPLRYSQHIWGEHEFGGTSLLYISDVDLNALGWPRHSLPPIPEITEPLISKTPHIGVAVLASLFGLNWILERRNRLMNEKYDREESEARNDE